MYTFKTKVSVVAALAFIGALQMSTPASADPPIWANSKWVKATETVCGDVHTLVLRGNDVKAPSPSSAPGCTITEENFHQINVSKLFLPKGNKGQVVASQVDAGYIYCGKGEAMVNLGGPGQAERAIREHPAPRGCTYSKRRYRTVSSLGSIAFTDVENGGTMTVKESLAMHAKERERIIAKCMSNPACVAEMNRMRSSSGSGTPNNPCIGNGNFSTYSNYQCTDSNGNRDPSGAFVAPR